MLAGLLFVLILE
ncbi:hypothetical protein CGLO_06573 [Colletotrichum gloeosporioides Cg-14]|uniref:Uncharacterized protein n=1 Tax=Colletotrichum gloeosporioides (strain Cg-14) TaxID=1237896 RepID=T0KE13_COLGC|nr:hypothetical protein CGLO_06573 [Colletotrichum gloeosporioides Cg-14]